jgi:glycosyltransferase involved in cell wall biosynthesis
VTVGGGDQLRGVAVTTPLPLSVVNNGGRELQALWSVDALRRQGVAAWPLDHWDWDRRYGLLHCFGTEGSLWETANRARAYGVRIIVSPILVMGRSTRPLRAWARVDALVPMRTSFRYRRDLLRLADAVIALTETERRVLVSVFGVSMARCHIIPNGVGDAFRDIGPEPSQRGGFVLCVGTIESRKAQLDVLRAGRRAGRPMVFVGEVRPDDPYGRIFEDEVAGATDVVWHRRLEAGSRELAAVYRSADALVLPSRAEGMPLVALEARAAGCPLILSDLPQHREAFPGAVFVRIGDDAALVEAISGASGLRSAQSGAAMPWSWDRVGSALRDVYASVAPEVVTAA